jgi:phosphatidylglycerophosphatase A
MIALLPTEGNPILMLLSFFAFRFFDIVKPWPVRWFDQKMKGSVGVLMDDIVAGGLAALCILLAEFAFVTHYE